MRDRAAKNRFFNSGGFNLSLAVNRAPQHRLSLRISRARTSTSKLRWIKEILRDEFNGRRAIGPESLLALRAKLSRVRGPSCGGLYWTSLTSTTS